MRDLENMLQGLGEKNKKAEQEGITMTDLEKKRIFAQTMTKIEQEKVNENRDKRIEDGEQPWKSSCGRDRCSISRNWWHKGSGGTWT